MIQISNVCKSYGSQELFEEVSFSVNSRERVGLVGRNGHGKTTLLRMIIGEEEPDSGNIAIPRNYKVAHMQQHLAFSADTVLQEVSLGLPSDQAHDTWRAEKILAGLGFEPEDMARHSDEFSGGFQVRINLAKVLVSNPDLLLLDEPTNYLDIVSIRWLIRFLQEWKRELILITHDRGFMDQVVTHVVGLHRKRVKKIQGDTQKYYEQIAAEEEIYEKTRINEAKRRKEVELFISRFRAKARLANLVQSRIKTLAKQEAKSRLEKIEILEFSFRSAPFSAKFLLACDDLAFGYENHLPLLIDGLSLTVSPGDRICIVGKNGKGKTTLLRILSGGLPPQDGEVKQHPMLRRGYFEQTNTVDLDPQKTVEEEILHADADCTQQMARDIAGAMMFSGDQALKKVAVLSGGEKSRLMLGKLLVAPCHMLLLDEPTNHLDMESCDSLLAAIDAFDGAVVLVTHNEMFLHTLANRLVVFDRGKQFSYEGSYQSFLNDVGWSDDQTLGSVSGPEAPDNRGSQSDKKAVRKIKAGIIQEKSRTLTPLSRAITRLEEEIETLEKEWNDTNTGLVEASTSGDVAMIADLARKEQALRSQIDSKYDELDRTMQEFDSKSQYYQEKLAGLAPD